MLLVLLLSCLHTWYYAIGALVVAVMTLLVIYVLDNKFGLLLFIIIYNNRPNAVVAKMISGILVASMAGTCETTGPEFGCTQQVQEVIMKDNLEKKVEKKL